MFETHGSETCTVYGALLQHIAPGPGRPRGDYRCMTAAACQAGPIPAARAMPSRADVFRLTPTIFPFPFSVFDSSRAHGPSHGINSLASVMYTQTHWGSAQWSLSDRLREKENNLLQKSAGLRTCRLLWCGQSGRLDLRGGQVLGKRWEGSAKGCHKPLPLPLQN